ncbi:MAG TPA: hypothetical protein VNZ59_11210, partial [Burkholderiales bacterium]|nr:hypothetical protein [Burkholderiales bacterium]
MTDRERLERPRMQASRPSREHMRRVRVAIPGQRLVQPDVVTTLEIVGLLRNEDPAGSPLVDGHEHDA